MSKLVSFAALGIAAALVPVAAGAGPPGSVGSGGLLCLSTSDVRWVVDTDGDAVRDPGEDTDCDQPVVDDSGAEPVVRQGSLAGPLCVQAVVGQLRARVALIADAAATDNVIDGLSNDGSAFTVLVEIRSGEQVFTLADSFVADGVDDLGLLNVGTWNNRLFGEGEIYNVGWTGLLFPTPDQQNGGTVTAGAFDALGVRLAQIAEQLGIVADATSVVPIVALATRDGARKNFALSSPTGCGGTGCGEGEVDHTSDDLASVAVYRLTLSFVEKQTTPPLTCG